MKYPPWIRQWFSELIAQSKFKVKLTQLKHSSAWLYKDGAIRHISNRFFSIIGMSWVNQNESMFESPLIDQREIGILGFLIRNKVRHKQILIQAKIEPGNVGIVQLAPTCQATASNSDKVHGGDSPPFSSWFSSNRNLFLSDSIQSEQGTRFFCKLNRNILAQSENEVEVGRFHRWINIDILLDLLDCDFLINTDSRSVLITSDWTCLVKRIPFTRKTDNFSYELSQSFKSSEEITNVSNLLQKLSEQRHKISQPHIVSLEKLKHWSLTPYGLTPINKKPFLVKQIEITAYGREVTHWDQPIIDSVSEGKIILVCGRYNHTLYFLFKPQIEPGLHDAIELGPSFVLEPGEIVSPPDKKINEGKIIVTTRQSDEGGRFYHDISRYSIIDIGKINNIAEEYWLNLKQIQTLLLNDSIFTNEARSVLSLLLKWL